MTSNENSGRTFELTLEIRAPVEAVWKALTDGAELSRWFPLTARVEPGLGGSIFISWGYDREGTAPITAWDPSRRFQWTEMTYPGGDHDRPAVPICVDIYLESLDGSTTLRLVHSGIGTESSWDGYYNSICRGWTFELRSLRHYLENHRGTERRVLWVRHRTDRPAAEIARRVLGPEGKILRGSLDGKREGEPYRLVPVDGSQPLEGVVQVNGLPHSFAATVENFNNAYFRFEVENLGKGLEAWLWLSTYNLDPVLFEGLDRRWRPALQKALD